MNDQVGLRVPAKLLPQLRAAVLDHLEEVVTELLGLIEEIEASAKLGAREADRRFAELLGLITPGYAFPEPGEWPAGPLDKLVIGDPYGIGLSLQALSDRRWHLLSQLRDYGARGESAGQLAGEVRLLTRVLKKAGVDLAVEDQQTDRKSAIARDGFALRLRSSHPNAHAYSEMPQITAILTRRVERLCRERDVTVEAAALRGRVTKTTWYDLRAGKTRDPHLSTILGLCTGAGIDPADLVAHLPTPPPRQRPARQP